MRKYLVVLDETDEARVALRFAARRASKTGGTVEMVVLITPPEFVQWGGVQAAMEEEGRLRAEAMIAQVAGELMEEMGVRPSILVERGEPVAVVKKLLAERSDVAALVVGAAATGSPGPLIAYISTEAGSLPCPVMIIPGKLDDEALDRLS
ncbi:MAG: universal stress protein [Sphingobium sp.]